MSLLAQLDRRIRYYGGLIVSCQPVPGSPLDNPAIVAAMALAAEAMRCGAWAVTVGSAITRLEHICGWYNTALKAAVCPANEQ
ncbi:TPA: hypothetical protein L7430_004284 [Klebsiella variicola]|uniref:hypothetical protein n=1 Tax=Klebsiella variicola TaxID=244366 RepID=UPI002A1F743B|nr:hypothetical protein [Klebsiella variicola]HEK5018678.1 hypothetical protein [Klebsiella variicola]